MKNVFQTCTSYKNRGVRCKPRYMPPPQLQTVSRMKKKPATLNASKQRTADVAVALDHHHKKHIMNAAATSVALASREAEVEVS